MVDRRCIWEKMIEDDNVSYMREERRVYADGRRRFGPLGRDSTAYSNNLCSFWPRNTAYPVLCGSNVAVRLVRILVVEDKATATLQNYFLRFLIPYFFFPSILLV